MVHFVVSRNLLRRHVSGAQKAVVALEIEHQLAREARKNQALAGGDHRPLLQKVAKAVVSPLHAAEQAAAVGTNHAYITDVKRYRSFLKRTNYDFEARPILLQVVN